MLVNHSVPLSSISRTVYHMVWEIKLRQKNKRYREGKGVAHCSVTHFNSQICKFNLGDTVMCSPGPIIPPHHRAVTQFMNVELRLYLNIRAGIEALLEV